MNENQKKAVEKLKDFVHAKVKSDNEWMHEPIEVKEIEVIESDRSLSELLGWTPVTVHVVIGYVGDENNYIVMRQREYRHFGIGRRGGFTTKKTGTQTKVHGLENCYYQGMYYL